MKKVRYFGIAALAAVPLALGGLATAAHAAPVTVTGTTHVYNDADSGAGGNTWAFDNLERTVTVSVAPVQNAADTAASKTDYTVTVSDAGSFQTIKGVATPNQAIPGEVIANSVSGTVAGAADYTLVVPNADVLTAGNFPAALNDNDTPATGAASLTDWPVQAFTPQAALADVTLTSFSYTYTTPAGEKWVDSSANGDGGTANDGNVTGILPLTVSAPTPTVLFDGHGVATAATREEVVYQQKGNAGWDHFVIVGPGALNGHQGWVNGVLGTNIGYYSGLEAGHGYTSCYTPVTARYSTTPVAGHGGCIYFVSNANVTSAVNVTAFTTAS